MQRLFLNQVFGALLGFGIGVLAWTGVGFFGLDLPQVCAFAFYVLGAAFGACVGGYGGSVARWCAGMAAGLGAIGFALGFVGPLLLQPDSPQGPLLGIFVTGPFGAIIGALLGLVIGVVRQPRQPEVNGRASA